MSSPGSLPRFQFSLRWLLIAITVVALLFGLGAFPAGKSLVGIVLAILLRGVLPTVAAVVAVFGRGDLRAFAIGALVVCILSPVSGLPAFAMEGLILATMIQLVSIGICGSAAVATRRWVERSNGMSDESDE